MPYIHLAEQGIRAFYVLNPTEKPVQGRWATAEPLSEPFLSSKPTLVLLHCTSMSSAQLHYQLFDPRLRQESNVLAIDSRLSGRTEDTMVEDSISLESVANTHAQVLDALSIPSYAVFGVGVMGSQCASWLAYKRPNQVRCIAMVSPGYLEVSPSMAEMFKELPAIVLRNKDGQGDGTGALPDIALTIGANYFVGPQARLESHREEYKTCFSWRYGVGRPSRDLLQVLDWGAARAPFPTKVLESLQIPIVILRGTQDTLVSPLEAVEEWASHLKNAKGGVVIHAVADAPHVISFTDPNIVNRFLAAFISRNYGQ